jgi:polynucleotide 5'-hydroxyl-kinase GRC3/NOL9
MDTDLGQKLVGPPACVTLGAGPTRSPDLVGLAFVGTTDPVKGWKSLQEGARALIDRAAAELVIVNTSGLVQGPGRALKVEKIQALEPDLLVALGYAPEIDAILSAHRILALRLPTAPGARRKSSGERRAGRQAAFRDYFRKARIQALRGLANGPHDPWPRGLLVGLADAEGIDLAIGLIMECGESGAAVLAPDLPGQVQRIKPGRLVLDQDFAETPAPAATGQDGAEAP